MVVIDTSPVVLRSRYMDSPEKGHGLFGSGKGTCQNKPRGRNRRAQPFHTLLTASYRRSDHIFLASKRKSKKTENAKKRFRGSKNNSSQLIHMVLCPSPVPPLQHRLLFSLARFSSLQTDGRLKKAEKMMIYTRAVSKHSVINGARTPYFSIDSLQVKRSR